MKHEEIINQLNSLLEKHNTFTKQEKEVIHLAIEIIKRNQLIDALKLLMTLINFGSKFF